MRGAIRPRGRPTLAALVVTLVAAGPARAQIVPPVPEPGRPWRALATGELSFPARWGPSLAGGGLVQLALGPERVETEEGFVVVHPPAWYLHAAGGLGISFDEDGDGGTGLAAALGLGVARRVDPTPISVAGLVVERRWGPEGTAAAARIEILDNLGVELGWIFVDDEDGEDGVFASIDWMRCLLADLGLGPCLP